MEETPGQPESSIIPAAQSQGLDLPATNSAENLTGEHLIVEAEWVRHYPPRRHRTLYAWIAFFLKLAVALALAWLFIVLPDGGLPAPLQTWKNPVIIFGLICFIGKTLFDTLFYDHFQF